MTQRPIRNWFALAVLAASALIVPGCATDTGDIDDTDDSVSELSLRHCPEAVSPVCGVNHRTYTNVCRAGSHRIAYAGACDADCGDLVCRAGQTCEPGARCPTTWPDGERHACDPVAPRCVTPPVDPCATTRCPTGSSCTVEGGRAVCLSQCASVRCAAGTTCVVVGNAVSCQPNACPPITQLCLRGYHHDNTPGVCRCVADACPPNTRLCIRGSHYDGTPGVCACVPDACPPNTRLCIRGSHYDGTPGVCACVPDACPPNMYFCIRGYHYDGTPGVCACVPDAALCTVDADCHLEDNYCGGCACAALTAGQHGPSCANPVQCFRQPCGGLTARCDAGHCTAR